MYQIPGSNSSRMENLRKFGNSITRAFRKEKQQSTEYQPLGHVGTSPAKKRSYQTGILAVSITINSILLLAFFYPFFRRATGLCELESDKLFGKVPWKLKVIENDERFVNAKPPSYMVGEVGINKTDSVNPWDEIYPSVWVAFPEPHIGGVDGRGMKMKHVAADPSLWEEESEGYGVAVMHQVHCVAVVKHALLTYEENGKFDGDQTHLHHCVETLRQAVMCHADTTLERPGMDNPHDVVLSGWGNTHLCRDWDSVLAVINKHALKHKPEGWSKMEKTDLKTRGGP